ncbi:hypothetical protein LTR36_004652 [Oleoguttula mirabilis]|uniref:Uncharacterized protein n=1 Tax=Oleoguttula mirabilis TaxID=1507867 RepID=A0AAV9JG72_9PEZI|nr:hypothetical protein LTR36_004652 [Oleoguttula mirabilis]
MAPSPTPQVFRLMDLAPELRNKIYFFAFHIGMPDEVEIFTAQSKVPSAALTIISRQVHNECVGLLHEATRRFWTEHKFFVAIAPDFFTDYLNYKATLEPRRQALRIPALRQLEIRLQHPNATGLPSIGLPSFQGSDVSPLHSPLPSPDSSAVASEDDLPRLNARPKLGSRKSSGTMIVSREHAAEAVESDIEEGDVRTMSPRRNSAEVDKLGEAARRDLIEQARVLQTSLQEIVDRVEEVKSEHEKLEGGNKFLQSYIGELMSTSKITSSAPKKGKGRNK